MRIVKRVIESSEIDEESMTISPFTLSPKNGNISITDSSSNKTHTYSMKAWSFPKWWDCTINDFPNGTQIKLTAAGTNKTVPVNKTQIKNFLQNNLGQKEIEVILNKGEDNEQEVKFIRLS